jgi:hypothetical protein
MKPTIGRIVHYWHRLEQPEAPDLVMGPLAAIVHQLRPDCGVDAVDLFVIGPGAQTRFVAGVFPGGTMQAKGTSYWIWPPREAGP